MHKFFAKTLFLGKKVIFLPECHSTNNYISHLIKKGDCPEGTVVWTDFQTEGKGQRGNRWESERGSNLLASVTFKMSWLQLKYQHLLTFIAGLAVRDALESYMIGHVSVKWPNDVYIDNKKICGVLCETMISGINIDSVVVGFGVNVNQQNFTNPNAISLRQLLGRPTDREEILELILAALEKWYLKLKSGGGEEQVLQAYCENLLGFKQNKTFDAEGEFEGMIVGVDDKGNLLVQVLSSATKTVDAGQVKSFGLKEIKMIL